MNVSVHVRLFPQHVDCLAVHSIGFHFMEKLNDLGRSLRDGPVQDVGVGGIFLVYFAGLFYC